MKISTKKCMKNDKKRPIYYKKCTKNEGSFGYEFCMRRQRGAAGNCFSAGASFGFWVYDMVMR